MLLAFLLVPYLVAALSSGEALKSGEAALKAAAESVITNPNNVYAGDDVGKIWDYVNFLWENNRRIEAGKYIEAGLSFEPFNYFYQAQMALVLSLQGNNAAAIDRARIVYDKTEDSGPALMVAGLLGEKPVQDLPALLKTDYGSPTVVLVTIDAVEPIIVDELRKRIADYLGIDVVIFRESLTPPPADRSHFIAEINRMRGRILALPEIQQHLQSQKIDAEKLHTDNDLFVTTMTAFLEKSNPSAAGDFAANMKRARLTGRQWKYDSLRDYLIGMLKPFRGSNWIVVGVTSLDMFMQDTNYVFAGTNPYAQAIISYHRFTGRFNHEPQNRRRLGDRLFKQFLSVFGLLNGMRRCTFPECARIFPRTLAEHDEKPAHLCRECRETLARLLGINIRP